MNTQSIVRVSGLLLATTFALEARADPPTEDEGVAPVQGFMLQGRYHQALGGSFIATGTSASTFFPSTPIMPAVLGYRGSFYAIGVGPMFWSLDRTGSTGSGTTLYGAGLHAEFVVARFFHRRAEAFLFPGFSFLVSGGTSSQTLWGFTFGFGGRYWLTHGLGLSVELSESIASLPTSSSLLSDSRVVAMQTIGSLGLTIVLGDR